MALDSQQEKLIQNGAAVSTDTALIQHAKNLAADLKIAKDKNHIEQIVFTLKTVTEELDRRGLQNPLISVDPTPPPPIPGVTMPPPAQSSRVTPPVPSFKVTGANVGVAVPNATGYNGGGVIAQSGARNAPSKSTPNVPPELAQMSRHNRSCSLCPSFIGENRNSDQVKIFGKSMGIPMCSRFFIPLGSLNSDGNQNLNIQREFGSKCAEFGYDPGYVTPDIQKTNRIAHMNTEMAKTQKEMTSGSAKPVKPTSCTSCAFYSDAASMTERLGIPQAGCALRGTLIPLGKASATAQDCTTGIENFDNAFAKEAKWNLIKPYVGNITVVDASNPAGSSLKHANLDPATYETDKPLTDEDREAGIRAWQKIMDPEKGSKRFVYMPIFDRESFSPEEQAKIPVAGVTPEDDHPELYEDHLGLLYICLVLWLVLHETPALNGVAGTGKTEFFRYVAWRMQIPFERFSITNSTELDELQGRMNLVATETGNKTEFNYGRVALAWGKRCILAIDEPNTGPNDVWQFFRPLTDNSKQLVLDVNNGERLDRNKYCLMGMAFNPSWDMKNVGTHEIGDADSSRLMHISVPMPNDAQERSIIRRRCELDEYTIPPEMMDAVMAIAKELRELAGQDAFPVHWGIRNQIKVARATAWFSMERAYRLAAADLLEPQFSDQLMVIVKSHTPQDGPGAKRGRGRPRTRNV